MPIQFHPASCPGCEATVAPRYSRYSRATAHPLYAPVLVGGVILTVALLVAGFWGSAVVTAGFLEGRQLLRKERGMLYVLAFLATLPVVALVTRLWWRALLRLPRTFPYTCEPCGWTGPCRVTGYAGPVPEPADDGTTSTGYRPARPSRAGRRVAWGVGILVALLLAVPVVFFLVTGLNPLVGVARWREVPFRNTAGGPCRVFHPGLVDERDAARLANFLASKTDFGGRNGADAVLERREERYVVAVFVDRAAFGPPVLDYYRGLLEGIRRDVLPGEAVAIECCEPTVNPTGTGEVRRTVIAVVD